jgi:hypothetical protein
MSLLSTLIQYKAGVAYGLVVSTVTVGVAIHEARNDTGLFGLAPIPGPTMYLSPTATPTVTETQTRVLPPSPSVSVITQTASPTALPSPTTTETLIVPLPVVTTATVTPSATSTPTSTPTPTATATRTPRNHANGLDCFVLIEVDNHVEVIKRPCPRPTP